MDLGARITAWLAHREMNRAALARAVGVTPAAVTAWLKKPGEPDSANPTQKNLEAIAVALGLTMAEFYGELPSTSSSTTAA